MAILKCKMCGGTLEVTDGQSVCECEYCGSKQTVPNSQDEGLQTLYNRANVLRMKSEFDKAAEIYEKILQKNETEAEAYWGLILCKYGIEYVEDPQTYRRVPTCHRASYDAVTADEDYKNAIKYADISQKILYEDEARAIDEIQRGILAIAQKEDPYDVFICYKETDENGKRTQDSVIANDIYYQLTQEGYKVFYAAITLESKLGSEYEPCIFSALNTAKVMLAIGTKPEYFNAVWVKNEWSRFLKLLKKDRSRLLIPCYKDMDPYELPEEFAHLQAQDMGKIGFISDLVRGIKKVIKKEEAPAPATAAGAAAAYSNNVTALIQRGYMALEDQEWAKAAEEKAEEERKAAQEKAEKEAKAKKTRLIAILAGAAAVIAAAAVVVVTKVIIPNNNYSAAVALMNEGKYEDAITAFTALDGYKDSADQIVACETAIKDIEYDAAAALMNEGKYEDAITAFTALDGYKDSADQIVACETAIKDIEYDAAAALMNEGKYEDAITAFTALDGYKDSADQIAACETVIKDPEYIAAVALVEQREYISAYESLSALNGYKDSAEIMKSIEVDYRIAPMKLAEVGSSVFFGTYEQDNDSSNGKESIEWIVLEKTESGILVISKDALDCQQYHSKRTDIKWETCSLREWMNDTFLNEAFSLEEQERILQTSVPADKNPKYSTDPGNGTTDKLFLLSITEAVKYFSSDVDRRCKPAAYAVARGAYESFGNCWWWLRSPGGDSKYAADVLSDGSVSYTDVNNDRGCVRPALWINLES
ncbi:MAG: DUF6273 domain-containing protein [Eubacteriales bacterium]|nr:DUF6273 domain-containing protein [Eubacteriales bacterium]